MKKYLIVIGMTLILLIVGLSGCTQNNESKDSDGDDYNDENELKDSDGDGHGDNNDDFPYDDRYYKKEYIIGEYSPTSYTLEDNQGNGATVYITSDWKYVIVDWEVVFPLSLTKEQQDNIFVEIKTPITPYEESEYAYSSTGHRNMELPVNANNWGEWHYSFRNKTYCLYETGDNLTIIVEATMYKIK